MMRDLTQARELMQRNQRATIGYTLSEVDDIWREWSAGLCAQWLMTDENDLMVEKLFAYHAQYRVVPYASVFEEDEEGQL